jgi:hypothetical protein
MAKLTAKIICGYMLVLLVAVGIFLVPKPVLADSCCTTADGTLTATPCTSNSDCGAPMSGGGAGGQCNGTCASGGTGGAGTTSSSSPSAGSLTNPLSGACSTIDQTKPDAGQKCIQLIIGNVIKAALGVVGSIALLMMTYGGYTWLTSMGNSERVEKGKNTLIWAVLGLIVIFGAYAITSYIITKLVTGQ